MAVGVKDVPIHFTRNGYIPKLRWIATKSVVLWDEEDKRGWLVNGISVLLHLVRASLIHYSTDDFSSCFLFDPGKFQDEIKYKPNSAAKILSDEYNMGLEIYPGKSEAYKEEETKEKGLRTKKSKAWKRKQGYYLFEDLVEHHYNILEQIMDHQTQAAGQNGVNLKTRLRKHLEGWDFYELASDHDPCPRVATLQALGYSWVDFARSIGAITLFGRGFGDIIQPIEFAGMCSEWKTLPKYRYCLAASVFDLKNIINRFGDEQMDSIKAAHGLMWHSPADAVAPCHCQGKSIRRFIPGKFKRHHDPVQVFCPEKLRLTASIKRPGTLEGAGAVVFGHNVTWKYRWKENGYEDLEEGEPTSKPSLPDHYILAGSTSPSSDSPQNGLDPSARSTISRSDGSTAGTTAYLPSSKVPISSPLVSQVDAGHAISYWKPSLGLSPKSRVSEAAAGSRRKSLRHERRRLPTVVLSQLRFPP